MKINVLSIDEKKLMDNLDIFVAEQNKNPYLIMSKDTSELIIDQYEETFPFKKFADLIHYQGYRVLIDNDLDIGEIDIR
jgi:hypothetical protein